MEHDFFNKPVVVHKLSTWRYTTLDMGAQGGFILYF